MNFKALMMSETHIVLSVHNGSRFIREQIQSIQDQTLEDWRLWVRDDGSTDDTLSVLEEIAASDPRIVIHPTDGRQRGVSGGFSWLIERLPDDARYVFCCDADDVWLPEKMELSKRVLCLAEASGSGPLLVHTDLQVTDSKLRTLNHSLWRYLKIRPEPVTLQRLIVENVATGPTILMNRDLAEKACPIPDEVPHHDWWITLVAAAFGKIVALPEATVLYRRHSTNHTGEYDEQTGGFRYWVRKVVRVLRRTDKLRFWLATSARQAEIFLDRFEEELPQEDQDMLRDYSEIPRLAFLKRKLRVLRLRALPGHGLAKNLSLLLRA